MSIFLLVSFIYSPMSYSECQKPSDQLRAQYQVTKQTATNNGVSSDLTLYRQKNNVAYQYNDQAIIESWHLQSNDKVSLTRFFEHEKRAIEYQPNEVKNPSSWLQTQQIISPEIRAKMSLISTTKQGCDVVQTFELSSDHQKVILKWLPALKLVKELTITTDNQSKQWQLIDLVMNDDIVKAQFTLWRDYKATDYADIGDNESDPFFRKMINLGFIKHGASGFYQADGQVISHGHH